MTNEEAIELLKNMHWSITTKMNGEVPSSLALNMAIKALEKPKAYNKADYIMALHKEYGCTITRAEEAHDKALEYLRSKAIVKG